MPDGPALALQDALIVALRANPGVTALVSGRSYDEPPQDVVFPYVRIGTINIDPLRLSGCTDESVTFSVEGHSRPVAGRVEAARLGHAIRLALDDAALSVAGYNLDWCQFTTQAVTRGTDGRSYIVVAAFEAALTPN